MRTTLHVSFLLGAACLVSCTSDDSDDGTSSDPNNMGDASVPDASGGDTTPHDSNPSPGELLSPSDAFTWHRVDDNALGAAFGDVADFDGDGKLDLLISAFGDPDRIAEFELPGGSVAIYLQGDDLDSWTRVPVLEGDDGVVWPNNSHFVDMDDDGDLDVLVPAGFLICGFANAPCGGVVWAENDGGSWIKHEVVTGDMPFVHHADVMDVNGDGKLDLVAVQETFPNASELVWFPAADTPVGFETTPQVIASGGGSHWEIVDVDDDGDDDIVSSEFFGASSMLATAVWFERVSAATDDAPAGQWERHVIDATQGPSIQVHWVEDLVGDGTPRLLASNHVNEGVNGLTSAVWAYALPADPSADTWPAAQLSDGITAIMNEGADMNLAPGTFAVGDIDHDGDTDVAVSGDGDKNLFWLAQQEDGTFDTRILHPGLGQGSVAAVEDLDGDGKLEVVAMGYEDNLVSVYAHQ